MDTLNMFSFLSKAYSNINAISAGGMKIKIHRRILKTMCVCNK